MDILYTLFGHGSDLNTWQMMLRTILIFFIALALIRFSGMRIFGIQSAFDTCVVIMLGAVLSRAVVGASPFIPVVASCAVLCMVHKLIARWSVTHPFTSHLVKGRPVLLYKEGKFYDRQLKKCALSTGDIMEEVRIGLHQDHLDNVAEIFMERTGKISFVCRQPAQ